MFTVKYMVKTAAVVAGNLRLEIYNLLCALNLLIISDKIETTWRIETKLRKNKTI